MYYLLSCLYFLVFFCHPLSAVLEIIEKERIVHECGVAFVKTRKPLAHYAQRYQDPAWGVKKLLTLMEKQRNRGQEGAGIASVKLDTPPGKEYLHRHRTASENALDLLVQQVMHDLHSSTALGDLSQDAKVWKNQSKFLGEVLLGHLRYATHSGFDEKYCQPYVHPDSILCKNFALAGNFNMTNTKEIFEKVQAWGFSPTNESDTQAVLEMIAYFLNSEYERAQRFRSDPDWIAILRNSAKNWDGGYVFCGIIGNGDALIFRDPAGIRPGYYYMNDEVIAAASERVALMDTFEVPAEDIVPIKPGYVIFIKKTGEIIEAPFADPLPEKQCSFERIYFSRANDPEIYAERKALGQEMAARVYKAIQGDLDHTIFTYVPHSSIAAYQGLIEGISKVSYEDAAHKSRLNNRRVRTEYLITKNQKTRTFISPSQNRKNVVSQLYDVIHGVVTPEDTLVVIEDSIVRGVTLRDSLVRKLASLNPKKMIIVSASPPIMYPDGYGIDISQLGQLVAFQATIALLKERQEDHLIEEVRERCEKQETLSNPVNEIDLIYKKFTLDEISQKVAALITPSQLSWQGEVEVLYQTLDGLHRSMPNYTGDWYFSGQYPTPGGFKVLNTSYLNWCSGVEGRSY